MANFFPEMGKRTVTCHSRLCFLSLPAFGDSPTKSKKIFFFSSESPIGVCQEDQERRKGKMGAWLDPLGRTWPAVGVGGSTRALRTCTP